MGGAAFDRKIATFRVFYLFGAILLMPPLAFGTITLGLGEASNSIAEEMTAFALSLAVGAGFLPATIPETQPPDSAA